MEILRNDSRAAAGWDNIRKGPVPEWVVECPYNLDYQSTQNGNHLTYLLLDRQVHAEQRDTYVRMAIRLESLEAVQNNSQWRLEFEPQTQSCVVHTLSLRRKGTTIDQLHLEKGRCLQREEGLERLIIDGWLTYLLVLEDVRVGDVLEWSYTRRDNPRILAENCFGFFALPGLIPIGKYHFLVRFGSPRAMNWKASADLKLEERRENGLTIWTWAGENYSGMKPEPRTPAWYVSEPWIEFSDCPDWKVVAAGVAHLWSRQSDPDTAVLDEWVKVAEDGGADLPSRITKAIEMVQDDCRYLSINLEFGGQIPTAPAQVARRRYGDCKDLSFLLVSLLQRLGVTARPVLVHASLQKTVGEWLPNPGLFNHAVVEFEAEGKRRWIDCTLKRQGGGAFNRFVHNFGLGLPVDAQAQGLTEFPKVAEQPNRCELRETILVDTAGANSRVAFVELAEGARADYQRNQFAANAIEEIARQSLQNCANRFGWANRMGVLQHHDDRVNNRFTTAEVFEVRGFLRLMADRKRYMFELPSHWLKQTFVMPENKERRSPFALPYPFHTTHILEVEAPSLRPMGGREIAHRFQLDNPFFRFNRQKKTGYKFWTMNYLVETVADVVPTNQIKQYREHVAAMWKESMWVLFLPAGYPRPKGSRNFGQLPATGAAKAPLQSTAAITASASNPVSAPVVATPTPARPSIAPKPVIPERSSHQRRRRSRHQAGLFSRIPATVKIVGIFFLVLALIVVLMVLLAASKYG
jgi:hypothetical protein